MVINLLANRKRNLAISRTIYQSQQVCVQLEQDNVSYIPKCTQEYYYLMENTQFFNSKTLLKGNKIIHTLNHDIMYASRYILAQVLTYISSFG